MGNHMMRSDRVTAGVALAVIWGAVMLVPVSGYTAQTPYEKCLKLRLDAGKKYESCHLSAFTKFNTQESAVAYPLFEGTQGRCRVDYQAAWDKARAKQFPSTPECNDPRLVDGGDGTVKDKLTGLQWEQKTDDGSLHDRDDRYAMTATPSGELNDGQVYSVFLASLNSAPCFAGHCDWRLPTLAELNTILKKEYSACVDDSTWGENIDPVFGPAPSFSVEQDFYWTATGDPDGPTAVTWSIAPSSCTLDRHSKSQLAYVRAVRGTSPLQ